MVKKEGKNVRDKKDKYVRAFNFVGHTREIPYNFRLMKIIILYEL